MYSSGSILTDVSIKLLILVIYFKSYMEYVPLVFVQLLVRSVQHSNRPFTRKNNKIKRRKIIRMCPRCGVGHFA